MSRYKGLMRWELLNKLEDRDYRIADLREALFQKTADLETAEAQLNRYETALKVLSRLGNEPHYGNSDGNMIAREALEQKE